MSEAPNPTPSLPAKDETPDAFLLPGIEQLVKDAVSAAITPETFALMKAAIEAQCHATATAQARIAELEKEMLVLTHCGCCRMPKAQCGCIGRTIRAANNPDVLQLEKDVKDLVSELEQERACNLADRRQSSELLEDLATLRTSAGETAQLLAAARAELGESNAQLSALLHEREEFIRFCQQSEFKPMVTGPIQLARAHISALLGAVAKAHEALLVGVTKCRWCDGSGQDNDGEGMLPHACPDCKDLNEALAALQPFLTQTKPAVML